VLEDTFVYEHEPEANFGAAEQLDIVDLPRAQGGGDRLAYLKFAFDGYDEPVQAAELRFRVTEDPAAPITLTVYGLASDDWSEHTMNWNNRVRAEETAIGTVRVAAAGWYKLDVTAYVQAQAAADDVATFRIMDPNTRGVLVQLAGKESGSAASHLVLNPSSNAQLRTLALDRGKLHPVFDGDVTAYTARVAYAVEAVSIAAEAEDARATVKVNGSPLAPGGISAPIPLQVGDNAIAVTVEAQDGTVSVYTVVVTRLANFVFEPADDTYVDENAPEESFGTAATLEVVDIPRAAGGGDRMAYLKFALDTMAEPVYSAVLHLYADEDPSAPVTLTVAGIPDDGWDERTMNWNNRISAGAVNVGTIRVASAGWHRLDVTAFVQSQMASDRTVTFRLMDPNTTNIGVSFRSGEHEANRPLLELNPGGITTQTYSPPVLRGPVHGNAPGRP
jgi:hypothetical protein